MIRLGALACILAVASLGDLRAQESLTATEVGRIVAQGVAEASARGRPATIAVVDRVGNVLAVFRMTGANNADPGFATLGVAPRSGLRTVAVIGNPRGADTGLNGVAFVPDTLAAIAKAVTGAYLSSQGNAFSTRTASQIVQNNFNPGEDRAPSGPLYGVQFSQLPCSDVNRRLSDGSSGPKRSPLGLAADPGGFPLYKNGIPVGGVGAISDGSYGLDANIFDRDADSDEIVATAATFGFEAPSGIRADRISVDGKLLRYSDAGFGNLASNPAAAASFASINGVLGQLVAVSGYYAATAVLAGQNFLQTGSGFLRQSTTYGVDAVVLTDDSGNARFPPQAGLGLGTTVDLTAAEVTAIIRNGLQIAYSARAQIRRPLNSFVQVTVSVVDSTGRLLGLARTPDAPVFGTDVSAQKARSAAFLSSTQAAASLTVADGLRSSIESPLSTYLSQMRALFGSASLADGQAYAARSIGNVARSTFPDGISGPVNGPLARSAVETTPFSTGLQLDLVFINIASHILFARGDAAADVDVGCTRLPAAIGTRPLANGLQIFPGGVPIYRGATLIGAVGVSGDGIDQDDMVAFLGLHRAGVELGTGIGNAPPAIRADRLAPRGTQLRYVSCPFAAFLGDRSRNVCAGL
jgi:uncharacterized protein GlcG (DUF336 family)